jgi:hypothetical protein
MPWTIEEIERIWSQAAPVDVPLDEVLRAFNAAEEVRGREWVFSTVCRIGGIEHWDLTSLWRVTRSARECRPSSEPSAVSS